MGWWGWWDRFWMRDALPKTRTVVSEVALPYSFVIWHPNLGVLEVDGSAPRSEFAIGDVVATRDDPKRWFVGSPGSWWAIREAAPDDIVEEVNRPSRRRERPRHRGYLDIQDFDDVASAEQAAAQHVETERKLEDLRRRTLWLLARRVGVEEQPFQMWLQSKNDRGEQIAGPAERRCPLPLASLYRIEFPDGEPPRTDTSRPDSAQLVRAIVSGFRDEFPPIEIELGSAAAFEQ